MKKRPHFLLTADNHISKTQINMRPVVRLKTAVCQSCSSQGGAEEEEKRRHWPQAPLCAISSLLWLAASVRAGGQWDWGGRKRWGGVGVEEERNLLPLFYNLAPRVVLRPHQLHLLQCILGLVRFHAACICFRTRIQLWFLRGIVHAQPRASPTAVLHSN